VALSRLSKVIEPGERSVVMPCSATVPINAQFEHPYICIPIRLRNFQKYTGTRSRVSRSVKYLVQSTGLYKVLGTVKCAQVKLYSHRAERYFSLGKSLTSSDVALPQ
jgi:hypothetical protein